MDRFFLRLLYCCILLWSSASGLRCRTGTDEDNEQYYKIMENCRRRYAMQDDGNSESSEESSNSNEDNFDRRMMSSGRYNDFGRNGMYNGDYGRTGMNGYRNQNNQRSRDWNNRSPYSNFFNRSTSRMNGRDNENQRFRSNRRNTNNWRFTNGANLDNRYEDQRYNYDNQQEQSVDQRGFPDRMAVNAVMLDDIQDPELRDFVEEAIVQCFHYVNLEGKQNKCQYSQSLLSCLIEKGEERCEDWNNHNK